MNIELAKINFDNLVFQGKFFWKYFYLIMAAILSAGSSSFAADKVPCSIQMLFTHDDYGPAAEYYLTAQVTNRTGRSIIGVSTLFYDEKSILLGNTELDCLNEGSSLNPGSTGQCSWLLQTIDGKMMEKFGTTTWTEIVNFQLKRLDSIAECKIKGFRYKNTN